MANVTDAREHRPLLRYSNAAVTLHWLTAVLVLFQIWLGLSFADMADGPRRANLVTLHRTIGATILIVVLARLTYRLFNPPPPRTWLARIRGTISGLSAFTGMASLAV